MSGIFRASVFAQSEWKAFPRLCRFAEDNLSDGEAFELLRVLQTMPRNSVQDGDFLDIAFCWANSPQGDAYWRAIAMRGVKVKTEWPVDPLFIGGDEADFKGPTGWEPDVVDGEHAMNITRDMF